MIIKTKTAIVDTNTYDSFCIEYSRYNNEYRLLAVNKNNFETIFAYSDANIEVVEKLLDTIYSKFNRIDSCMDLGV